MHASASVGVQWATLPTQSTIPQASLLGLPTELRLQIYHHLFSSPSARAGKSWTEHCCTWSPGREAPLLVTSATSDHRNARGGRWLRCTCLSHLQPALLRSCRQIHAEAIPVFYDAAEWRIKVPFAKRETQATRDMAALIEVLAAQPERTRQRVRRMVLTGTGRDFSASNLTFLLPKYDGEVLVQVVGRQMARLLPGLREVRLHIDLCDSGQVGFGSDEIEDLAIWSLAVLVKNLERVRRVVLDCQFDARVAGNQAYVRKIEGLLVGRLRNRIGQLTDNIEVRCGH